MNSRKTLTRLACLVLCLLLSLPLAAGAQEEWSPKTAAEAMVQQLVDGEYAAIYAELDPSMSASVTEEQIVQAWESVVEAMGPFVAIEQAVEADQNGMQIVQFLISHETGQQITTFAFGPTQTLMALYIQPGLVYVTEEPLPVPEGAVEEEITLRAGEEDASEGILTIPAGEAPFTAVILIHGSGASDRDETVYGLKPFRDIAMGLAAEGIASLRYDKYPFAHPEQAAEDGSMTIAQEYEKDLLDALALLQDDSRIGDIYLVGHSEGGLLMPRLLKLADGAAKGGILLAGSPRPLWEIQWMQNEDVIATLEGAQKEEARALVDAELEKAERLLDMTEEELQAETLFGVTATYQADIARVDAIETAKELALPLLILQGGKDFQVKADIDYAAWQEGLDGEPYVTFKLYPEMTHVFMVLEGESTGGANDYTHGGHVAQEVIDDMAAWIKAQ